MQLCRRCNSLEDMETKVLRVQRLALCVRYVSYLSRGIDRPVVRKNCVGHKFAPSTFE
jgi:hypothetical protein